MILLSRDQDNYDLNCDILIAEILEYQERLWEDNQFCECGANGLKSCSCSSDKKSRFLKRRKRKVNEKFGDRLDQALMGQVPTVEGDLQR